MNIHQWAERHQIAAPAMQELLHLLGLGEPSITAPNANTTEAGVQQATRLRAAQLGRRLWRNNSGATQDETGRVIRFGLGNDSAQSNKVFKSSDLIGITPTQCTCGRVWGLFTAIEVKAPGWHITPGDARAQAQLNFINLVNAFGGIGKFLTNAEDL